MVESYLKRIKANQSTSKKPEVENFISIRADIYDDLQSSHIQSSQKGRAVFMLRDDFVFVKKKREQKKIWKDLDELKEESLNEEQKVHNVLQPVKLKRSSQFPEDDEEVLPTFNFQP